MPLTIHDLPPRFAAEYGRLFANRPFYVSLGVGERQGPFLFRTAPDRLVPIGDYVAWAMLRRVGTAPNGAPMLMPTYLQAQQRGQQPDPYHGADYVQLALDESYTATQPEPGGTRHQA